MDRLPVLQSFTIKQPGDALKQVQETVIQDVYEKMKALECQLGPMRGFEYEPTPGYTPPYQQYGNRSLQTEGSLAGRITEVE